MRHDLCPAVTSVKEKGGHHPATQHQPILCENCMRFITTLLLLTLVCACAVPQPRSHQPLPTAATYAASKDAVWAAVMSEIAINYRVQALDRESGFLGFETMDIPIGPGQSMPEWVFMPDVLFGTWEALSLSMNVLVEELEANMTSVASFK